MGFPQAIAELIPSVMAKLGLDHKVKEVEIVRDWEKIVGQDVAKHSQPVSLENGLLTVNVDSSPWLNELERYFKTVILEKIQERLGKKTVWKIRFRVDD